MTRKGRRNEAHRGLGVNRRSGVFRTQNRGRWRGGGEARSPIWDALNPPEQPPGHAHLHPPANQNLLLPSNPTVSTPLPPGLPLPPGFAAPLAAPHQPLWPGHDAAAQDRPVRRVERVVSASERDFATRGRWGEEPPLPLPGKVRDRTLHGQPPPFPSVGPATHGGHWEAGSHKGRFQMGYQAMPSAEGALGGGVDLQRAGPRRRVSLVGDRTTQPATDNLLGSRGSLGHAIESRRDEPFGPRGGPRGQDGGVFSAILPAGHNTTSWRGDGSGIKRGSGRGSRKSVKRVVTEFDPPGTFHSGQIAEERGQIQARASTSDFAGSGAGNTFSGKDMPGQPIAERTPSGAYDQPTSPKAQGDGRGGEWREDLSRSGVLLSTEQQHAGADVWGGVTGVGQTSVPAESDDAMDAEPKRDDSSALEFPPGFEPASVRAAPRQLPLGMGVIGSEGQPVIDDIKPHAAPDARVGGHRGGSTGAYVPAARLQNFGGGEAGSLILPLVDGCCESYSMLTGAIRHAPCGSL
jgi:hypothetical protein